MHSLNIHQKAPLFILKGSLYTYGAHSQKITTVDWSLKDNLNKIIILYFYSGSFTDNATRNLLNLNTMIDSFQNLGALVLAISTDSIHTQKAYLEKLQELNSKNFQENLIDRSIQASQHSQTHSQIQNSNSEANLEENSKNILEQSPEFDLESNNSNLEKNNEEGLENRESLDSIRQYVQQQVQYQKTGDSPSTDKIQLNLLSDLTRFVSFDYEAFLDSNNLPIDSIFIIKDGYLKYIQKAWQGLRLDWNQILRVTEDIKKS